MWASKPAGWIAFAPVILHTAPFFPPPLWTRIDFSKSIDIGLAAILAITTESPTLVVLFLCFMLRRRCCWASSLRSTSLHSLRILQCFAIRTVISSYWTFSRVQTYYKASTFEGRAVWGGKLKRAGNMLGNTNIPWQNLFLTSLHLNLKAKYGPEVPEQQKYTFRGTSPWEPGGGNGPKKGNRR